MNTEKLPSSFDSISRFIFNNLDIKGEVAQTANSFNKLLGDHKYPRCLRKLLGEMQVAIALMTETIKFEGNIMLQLRGDGKLHYAFVNSNDKQETRGIAVWEGEVSDQDTWNNLLGKNPVLTITVIPNNGNQYQGIIDLNHENLNQCIEDYYKQSVQIDTRVWLWCDENTLRSAGIIIQKLPTKDEEKLKNDFEHISVLIDSMTKAEVLNLESNEILYRMFHQESVNVFEGKKIVWKCSCGKDVFRERLSELPQEELKQLLEEQGGFSVECQSCGRKYEFTKKESLEIIKNAAQKSQNAPK